MNKLFLGLLLLVVLVTIVGGVYFFFHTTVPTTPAQVENTASLPVADNALPSVTTQAGTIATSGSLAIPTTIDDKTVIARDFTADSSTNQDTLDPQLFYLAGQATTSPFSISYTTRTHLFVITLREEPLGATRGAAEQFLLASLAVAPTEACLLATDVTVASGTSPLYEGKNLGLSFCPGATQLPQ